MIPEALDLGSVESILYCSLQALECGEQYNVDDQWPRNGVSQYQGFDQGCPVFPEPHLSARVDPLDLQYFEGDPGSGDVSLKDAVGPDSEPTTPPISTSFLERSNGNEHLLDTAEWRWDPFAPAVVMGGGDGRTDGPLRIVCKQCQFLCSTSAQLEIHAKSARHKAFRCSKCGRGYLRRDTLARHAATHKTDVHFCEHCSEVGATKGFTRKDHLLAHVKSRHTSVSIECFDLDPAQEVREIKIALNDILGQDNPAVKSIDQKPDFDQYVKTQLARSLAELALYRPERLRTRTRERLQRRAS